MGIELDLGEVWQQFGLQELQDSIRTLFPQYSISVQELLGLLWKGEILEVLRGLTRSVTEPVSSQFAGMRNVLVWLLVLGILSALMTHFMEIFDKHQIADLSFYFMYLCVTAVLLQCFLQAAGTVKDTLDNIVTFIRLLVPTYLMTVGLAAGAVTAGAYYGLMLLILYGVEKLLIAGVLPFVYSYCMLSVVNGIWTEEKLTLLIDLLGKGIRAALKLFIGIVTGIGIFQTAITPMVDAMKNSALQKILSVIPGIGDAANGVLEMVIGSAVVIRNSVGVLLMILLLLLCAAPLLKVLLIACGLKAAAALIGMISDHRLTAVTDRVGECGLLLVRTVGTALFLFLIAISIMATSVRG